MKKAIDRLITLVVILVCITPFFVMGLPFIAPYFPSLMGKVVSEDMSDIVSVEAEETVYPYIFETDNVMYFPTNFYNSVLEEHIGNIDAAYSWLTFEGDFSGNTPVYGTIEKVTKEEFMARSEAKGEGDSKHVLPGAKAAVRSFGYTGKKLMGSDGVRYPVEYDNRIPKADTYAPFEENDKKQPDYLVGQDSYNTRDVSYFPCLDLGFITISITDAYKNIGFELEHENVKVTKVMGVTNNPPDLVTIPGYIAVVEADTTAISIPEEMKGCEWLPEEGETRHVTYMVNYWAYFVLFEDGLMQKSLDVSYIQVLDYQ